MKRTEPRIGKIITAIALAITLLLSTNGITMAFADSAKGEAKVTTKSLNVREQPSADAGILYTLARDNVVTLLDTSNKDWYQVSYKGKVGFVAAEFVAIVKEPTGSAASSPLQQTDSTVGSSQQDVPSAPIDAEIYDFLVSMGYQAGDPVSIYHNGQSMSFIMPGTSAPIQAPSALVPPTINANGSAPVFIATNPAGDSVITYADGSNSLMQGESMNHSGSGTAFLKMGDSGSQVTQLQTALFALGCFNQQPTGYFGEVTRASVQAYQATRNLPLTTDVAEELYIAIVAEGLGAQYAPQMTTPTPSRAVVEMATWSEVNAFWKPGVVAKVTDVRTGISWNFKRWAGSKHADVEPLTATDTALMTQAYGGKIDYIRHPLWVELDGRIFAASLYGEPHSTDTIPDNNFRGQCCVHFVNSKTHDSDRVDADHQAAIREAYNAAQR